MKRILMAVLLGAFSGCASMPPQYTGIRLRYDLLLMLANAQAEFKRETVLCLQGKTDKDGVLIVDGLAPTWIGTQTTNSVRFMNCEHTNTGVVGWWHNHPIQPWGEACMASDVDLETFRVIESYVVMLISCSPETLIYYFKADGREHRIELPMSSHPAG